ncbi:MAG TPA: penicillin acylase family protein [Candidatus Kapabacteria bacterium]|nr:penicillin acylase family protein [Candidatus Kapabacteria bacterium]
MLLRFIIGLGFVVALLVIGGLLLGGAMMKDSIPKYEGQISVAGLGASVSIERDEHGPAMGGPTTVYQATYNMWDPYKMRVGPSMRLIADMKTNSLFAALPTGNAESVFGDHYKDMLDMFKRGDFVEIPLTERKPGWRKLELVPGQ